MKCTKTAQCLSTSLKYLCIVVILCIAHIPSQCQSESNPSTVDSFYQIVVSSQGYQKVSALLNLSKYYSPNELDKGLEIAKEALQLSKSIQDSTGLMKSLMAIGEIYRLEGKYDSLKITLDEVLPIALEIGDQETLFFCYTNVASYHERVGDLTKALAYSNKALEISPPNKKYKIYNNQGRIYHQLGNVTESIELYEQALQQAIELKNKNAEAVISNNSGASYVNIRPRKKAMEYFNKALKIKRELGDKRGQLYSLMNLAEFELTHQDDSEYADIGMQIAKEINDERFITVFTVLESKKLLLKNRIQEGIDLLLPYYKQEQQEPTFHNLHVLRGLANLYLAQGEYQKAEKIGLEMKSLGEQNNNFEANLNASEILIDVYANNKNAEKYLALASNFYKMRDSIENQQFVDNFALMEANLDKEQAEKVALLNDVVIQKTRSRNLFGLAALLISILLGSMLFIRSKLAKAQKKIIAQKKESLILLEDRNLMLKENAAIKKRFYANVSHEFRTPLTLIMGPLNQLIDTSTNESNTKMLKGALRHSKKLLSMVNQLLDLAKIESNHLQLEVDQYEFISFSREIFKSFDPLFQSKHIAMEFDTDIDKISLCFDLEKMEIVLFNILSNAIKFTAKNGSISMKIINEEDAIKIMISDTGTGISSSNIPFIFDRFFRVENSKENAIEGSGIGLSLAKELVELHHGTIAVKSDVGVGTQFTLLLYKGKDHFSADSLTHNLNGKVKSSTDIELMSSISTPDAAIDTQLKPKQSNKPTVLIVEDNKEVLDYIKSTLTDQFNILEAENGAIGLELVNNHMPELIISDVMMPIMDGFQLCNRVKENVETSHIPIILLTARVETNSKIAGLELGADDYLVKPFNPKELNVRVRNLIELRVQLRQKLLTTPTLQIKSLEGNPVEQKFIADIAEVLTTHMHEPSFGVNSLADAIGLSKSQLNRKLKSILDMTANKFIQYKRLNKSLLLLESEDKNVSEVCYLVGFSSVAYFVKCFKDQFGITPGSIKKA